MRLSLGVNEIVTLEISSIVELEANKTSFSSSTTHHDLVEATLLVEMTLLNTKSKINELYEVVKLLIAEIALDAT